MEQSCATLQVEQTPDMWSVGSARNSDVVASFRDAPAKPQAVTLVNQAKRAGATVYIRVDSEEIRLAAGEKRSVLCKAPDKMKFFTGLRSDDEKSWKPLYPTPTHTYEFRLARQLSGRSIWTTGFTNSVGMKLTLIYPGRFRMGQRKAFAQLLRRYGINPGEYTLTLEGERPAHEVSITKPFFMGTHEVTVSQFQQLAQDMKYRTEAEQREGRSNVFVDGRGDFREQLGLSWRAAGFPQGPDHPVVHVTWDDAARFCRWLSFKEQHGYGLPTEAQWEYAARAGTNTLFWSGDNPEGLTRIANVRDASLRRRFPNYPETLFSRDGYVHTSPVGRFPANPFGLHDMIGNVWEWCADWYDKDYYRTSPREDPPGPFIGQSRAYRGGCFY